MMGGIVDGDSRMSAVPGFCRRRVRGRLHGAIALARVTVGPYRFGRAPRKYAAKFAAGAAGRIPQPAKPTPPCACLAPFDRSNGSEAPYAIQHALQVVRDWSASSGGVEMREATDKVRALRVRAAKIGVQGNREYNPGWHTALDLANLLTVSEAIAVAGLERKESRGGHFRDDYPDKDPQFAKFNIVVRKGADGSMQLERRPLAPMPAELQAIIEEQKA
jgi:succinate dehydrogenase / fumarate reductase flavoprotein subunit